MSHPGAISRKRLHSLEGHLKQENPILLQVVKGFRQLDRVGQRMGILTNGESFSSRIPWWPLISVLGTFSSGKSTFINHYLGETLQRTGNQAVDDKFTVMSFSSNDASQTLPGVALDADPRFPFYQMSRNLEQETLGEGQRIDAYLQLKTTKSERLRGKILIDSPGFDADAQRTSTLQIIDHIINLSDLVLVFFDARHPESGAMRDTLQHLVGNTIHRSDSGKFLYILNQLDTTAREDNPEEVVGAWQRALAEQGLTAGRFYAIYNPDCAVPIEDEHLRNRFERKRDHDLGEIHERMHQVESERAYRIVASLEKISRDIFDEVVPETTKLLARWRRRTLITEAVLIALFIAALGTLSVQLGYWSGFTFSAPWLSSLGSNPAYLYTAAGIGAGLLTANHFLCRRFARRSLLRRLQKTAAPPRVAAAFARSTRWWRSLLNRNPAGWGFRSKHSLNQILDNTDHFVQSLNDQFANPSGTGVASVTAAVPSDAAPMPTGEVPHIRTVA
ncbi:MAG TPA: dynamin family protein [Chromatiaceae bacterium]|nr:dynamin family protein [Chromatiaceae bacterium]HIB84727.1 dynamin family protein [Chromatiaceae bacterium]